MKKKKKQLILYTSFISAPSKAVPGVKVVPITTTSVRVSWEPLAEQHWSGDFATGGYRVLFQPVSDFPTPLQQTPKQDVPGIGVSNTSFTRGMPNIFFFSFFQSI